jgi:L-lactate utilization protein LutB
MARSLCFLSRHNKVVMKVFLFHNRARFPELCAPTLYSPLSKAHKAAQQKQVFCSACCMCSSALPLSLAAAQMYSIQKHPARRAVQCSMPRIAHKKETLLCCLGSTMCEGEKRQFFRFLLFGAAVRFFFSSLEP